MHCQYIAVYCNAIMHTLSRAIMHTLGRVLRLGMCLPKPTGGTTLGYKAWKGASVVHEGHAHQPLRPTKYVSAYVTRINVSMSPLYSTLTA